MARPLRLEYEGAVYHITSRGNERGKVFFSESDYRKFLHYLSDAKEKYGILLHGYVLMTNHYHLLIETHEAYLSKVRENIRVRCVLSVLTANMMQDRAGKRHAGHNVPEISNLG